MSGLLGQAIWAKWNVEWGGWSKAYHFKYVGSKYIWFWRNILSGYLVLKESIVTIFGFEDKDIWRKIAQIWNRVGGLKQRISFPGETSDSHLHSAMHLFESQYCNIAKMESGHEVIEICQYKGKPVFACNTAICYCQYYCLTTMSNV